MQSSARKSTVGKTAVQLPELRIRVDDDLLEAFDHLCGVAGDLVGAVPPQLIAKHVLDITADGDWPVRQAAMMAIVARFRYAHRDQLRVSQRPKTATGLGLYQTRRFRSNARPYDTQLWSVLPLRASCGCPDFVRNSLGICKHILVALIDLLQRPRKFECALAVAPDSVGPALRWHPVRPMLGMGDWLERTTLRSNHGSAAVAVRAAKWFQLPGPDVATTLRGLSTGMPSGMPLKDRSGLGARRRDLVEDLLAFVQHEQRRDERDGHDGWDPALLRLLRYEKERLERIASDGLTPRQIAGHLRNLKCKLYAYQTDGVRRVLAAGRLLLADDMGLGKTIQAVACCHVWFRTHQVKRGLVIVPASLKSQWLREWHHFSDTPVRVVDGSPTERQAIYRNQKSGYLIANYEQVLRDLPLMHGWSPDAVVLDEAQRIKNWATKTASYVKQLQPRLRLVLTGTPLENRLDELYSILEWVDPLALEPVWRLGPWHTAWTDGRHEAKGARHLDTLRERLQPSLMRRVRQEVLDQLPARTDTRVSVALTPVQQNAHHDYSQSIAQLVRLSKKRPLSQVEFFRLMSLLTMQRMICNGMALFEYKDTWNSLRRQQPTNAVLERLASPKLVEFRELVRSLVIDQRRKVLVFSQWRRMLQLAHWVVQDLLAADGCRAVFFSGHESQKRRTHNIVDFHDDPNARLMLATDAGGVGLNLQRAANCCINLEVPWNPAVLEQRVGRIYRLGQKHPIEVYNLVSEDGLESHICSLVGNKKALFTGLFDGTCNEVAFERSGSFLSKVESVIEDLPALTLAGAEGDNFVDDDSGDRLGDDDAASSAIDSAAVNDDAASLAMDSASVGDDARDDVEPVVGGDSMAADNEVSGPALAARVGEAFAKVRMRAQNDGSLTLEAPPEAAAALAAVFRGMADMFGRTASN